MNRLLASLLLCTCTLSAAGDNQVVVDSFEVVWTTLRDHYWDATMGGLNWQKLHDQYLAKVQAASGIEDARKAMNELIHKLPSSHLALIPSEAYSPSEIDSKTARKPIGGSGTPGLTVTLIDRQIVVEFSDNPDVHPGWIIQSIDRDKIQRLLKIADESDATLLPHLVRTWLSGPVGSAAHVVFDKGDGSEITLDLPRQAPSGKLVQFTNLPPMRVIAQHKKLPGGVGYMRLNVFLDPVSVMPEIEQAISDLRSCPGIVLDLRNNPGGLEIMAAGIAGWFVADEGQILGTMIGRNSKSDFEINPRLEPYTGKLAILVNGDSASTSEFLAQGLKDLGRARIFGTQTAGEALPSRVIELPDGDRFQYPEANYTSFKGRVLEGNGVAPDVITPPTISGLLAGHDAALESAITWIAAK